MKYKELLERLQQLNEVQLDQDVVFCSEEVSYKINTLEVLEKALYYDSENPEDGCFELELGQDNSELEIAYDFGYPLLTD